MPQSQGEVATPPIVVLDVLEVAERVKYPPRTIRELIRLSEFPGPIDPRRKVRSWRWSEPVIDSYCRGEWRSDVAEVAS